MRVRFLLVDFSVFETEINLTLESIQPISKERHVVFTLLKINTPIVRRGYLGNNLHLS